MTRVELERMAEAARPLHDDEWGSDRQVEAENAFYLALEETLGVCLDDDPAWRVATYKATTEECIDHALERVRRYFDWSGT